MICAIDSGMGDSYIWMHNGGQTTLESYGGDIRLIPKEHIDYLKSRPLYFENEDLFVSHAPVSDFRRIPKHKHSRDPDVLEHFIWARSRPEQPYGNKLMIYGHNGRYSETTYIDGHGKLKKIAICVDNSHAKQVMGYHYPSGKIYTQNYQY